MRFFERLTYALGICLAFTYGFEEFIGSFILVCLIIVTSFIGAIVEGLRFTQWIFLVAFVPHIVLVIMDVFSYIALGIYCCFLSFSIIASLIFGEANFNGIQLIGPFQVGHMDYHTKDGIAISIFYPMDKTEYNKQINQTGKNSYWFRYGYQSRLGLTKATADWGKEDHPSPWIYKYLDDVKMDTVQDGKLSEQFTKENGQKLIPLVFCHGLTGSRTTQTGTCRDLASHGYIVFTLSHFDGTANHSVKKNGETKFWSSMHDVRDIELRREQTKIRKDEVNGLIDSIVEQDYPQEIFPNEQNSQNISFDLDKLIIAGHSFGGMTACVVAEQDVRVKAVFTFDPWLYIVHEQIAAGEFSIQQPQCHILSEGFSPIVEDFFGYDTVKVLDKFIKNSNNSSSAESIVLKDINHYHQCDAIVLVTMESFLKSGNKWQTNVCELYLLNSQVAMKFLHKQGFGNFKLDNLDKQLTKMKKHIKYVQEYDPQVEKVQNEIIGEGDDENQQLIDKKND